jgi:hypothetical protein
MSNGTHVKDETFEVLIRKHERGKWIQMFSLEN